MKFLNNEASSNTKDGSESRNSFDDYSNYLASVRNQLPASAHAFAAAIWHYDFSDHRCPHDCWVDSMSIMEVPSGDRQQDRYIAIKVRLLGAYHDGFLELSYKKVKSYSLLSPTEFNLPPLNVGHGDWLIDEVRVSETGLVLHEIEFSRGSCWLIECEDIEYTWEPISI